MARLAAMTIAHRQINSRFARLARAFHRQTATRSHLHHERRHRAAEVTSLGEEIADVARVDSIAVGQIGASHLLLHVRFCTRLAEPVRLNSSRA